MRVRIGASPVVVLTLLLLLPACGGENTPGTPTPPVASPAASPDHTPEATPQATPDPATTPEPPPDGIGTGTGPVTVERGTAWGISGLVPPNFPDVADDDWAVLYRQIGDLGGWAGTFASWTPDEGMPEIMRSHSQSITARAFEFRTIPGVGFTPPDASQPGATVDFTNPDDVETYTESLVDLARDVRPAYLGIGNEVNLTWEQHPEIFVAFAAALPGIAEAVREASPSTEVFTTFQLEFLRGGGAISGIAREPRWDLVDAVSDDLDFVGFTTYPWFDYATPEEIPDDYYTSVGERVDKPVGFTEVAWPAGADENAPAQLGASTPELQAGFIERLEPLLEGVDPVLMLWVHAYDTPEAGALFGTLGLHESGGEPRPAAAAWERLVDALS